MSAFLRTLFVPLVAVLLLAGCEVSNSVDPIVDEQQLVGGVDLTEIFAEPTQAEIQSVLTDWAARNPVAADVNVLVQETISVGTGTPATLSIVSHVVDGQTHYGAVIQPDLSLIHI